MNNYKFIISGRIQGVYYRKNIYENASKVGFCGYVKNLPNSTVEAKISCEEENLGKFISILRQGSPNSTVDKITQSNTNESFIDKFEIRY